MTDLRDRFHTLDDLHAPDLWREIESRTLAAPQRGMRPLPWVLIIVTLLLAIAVGAAALIGSGLVHPHRTSLWTRTGSMVEGRFGHTATLLLDGSVLVVGGENGTALATAELYDPAKGTWNATGAMLETRYGHTATLLPDGTVLVVGGSAGGDGPAVLATAEIYDPARGTWTATDSMIEVHGGFTATRLPDGRVLVAGGYNSSGLGLPASAELFDAITATWSPAGLMNQARSDATATLLLNGEVLVAGGFNPNGNVPYAELFDPRGESWSTAGNMTHARAGHTATLLPDGRVLVVGGYVSGMNLMVPSAELYDPGTGRWTATGAMVAGRAEHTATLLPDGRVLVAGGYSSWTGTSQVPVPFGEIYDPASGTWTATGAMIEVRGGHTATLLNDGQVLVAGGNGLDLASAELFDPRSGN